jgi:hypothetical protein
LLTTVFGSNKTNSSLRFRQLSSIQPKEKPAALRSGSVGSTTFKAAGFDESPEMPRIVTEWKGKEANMSKDVKEQEEESLVLINNIFVNTTAGNAVITNGTGTARRQGPGNTWKVVISSGNQTQKPKWPDVYTVGVNNVPPEFPTTQMKLTSVEGRFPYTFAE